MRPGWGRRVAPFGRWPRDDPSSLLTLSSNGTISTKPAKVGTFTSRNEINSQDSAPLEGWRRPVFDVAGRRSVDSSFEQTSTLDIRTSFASSSPVALSEVKRAHWVGRTPGCAAGSGMLVRVFEAGAAGDGLMDPSIIAKESCVPTPRFRQPRTAEAFLAEDAWVHRRQDAHVVSTHLDQPVRNDDEQNCQGEISDESVACLSRHRHATQ